MKESEMLQSTLSKNSESRPTVGRRRVWWLLIAVLPLSAALWWQRGRISPGLQPMQNGIAALSAGRPDKAEAEWRQAIQADPRLPEPYRLLAEFYVQSGHPEKAVPLLERLKQIAPTTPGLYSKLAETYTLTNQSDKAMEAAKLATEKEPDNSTGHVLLGIQKANRKDTRGAVEALSRASLLAPDDPKIVTTLGQTQLDAGDFEGAERSARQAIAKKADFATAYFVLGWSYSRRTPTPDNLKEAIGAFTRFVELAPDRADGFAELGRLYLLAKQPKQAIAALETARKSGLDDAQLAFDLSRAYREAGNAAEADKLQAEFKRISDYSIRYDALMKRITTNPANIEAALELIELQTGAKRWADAEALIGRLLTARPSDPRVLRAAIATYEGLGQKEAAQVLRNRLKVGSGSQGVKP